MTSIAIRKYLAPGESEWEDVVDRVVRTMRELNPNGLWDDERLRRLREALTNMEFLPGGRILANIGRGKHLTLHNCFAVAIKDDLGEIFETVKKIALITGASGGVGVNFSPLREEGAVVVRKESTASGPVSFMRVVDVTADVVKQTSRRAALLACLEVDHPDILQFIRCKEVEGKLPNFNISVMVDGDFMRRVRGRDSLPLISRNKTGYRLGDRYRDEWIVRREPARRIWDEIVEHAWLNGEPGMLFLENMNRHNLALAVKGYIRSVNPCGEITLYDDPPESCCLGSINLASIVRDGKPDYQKLEDLVRLATVFLDSILDISYYPLEEIHQGVQYFRRIGVGITGFHDFLMKQGVRYSSEEAIRIADKLGRVLYETADETSRMLVEEHRLDMAPVFRDLMKVNALAIRPRRNIGLLSVPPCGSISLLANVSSGSEPYFRKRFIKRTIFGDLEYEVGYDDDVFESALDIDPIHKIKVVAALQNWVDNAISQTVNLPHEATVEDVSAIFFHAWRMGLKGVTVYRDGSRQEQILKEDSGEETCPVCGFQLQVKEGCVSCPKCGWSKCAL